MFLNIISDWAVILGTCTDRIFKFQERPCQSKCGCDNVMETSVRLGHPFVTGVFLSHLARALSRIDADTSPPDLKKQSRGPGLNKTNLSKRTLNDIWKIHAIYTATKNIFQRVSVSLRGTVFLHRLTRFPATSHYPLSRKYTPTSTVLIEADTIQLATSIFWVFPFFFSFSSFILATWPTVHVPFSSSHNQHYKLQQKSVIHTYARASVSWFCMVISPPPFFMFTLPISLLLVPSPGTSLIFSHYFS